MTYLQFHLIFNVPLVAFLLWRARRKMTAVHWKWFGAVALIVLAFTFPWDNWAVGKGIWGFDDERILFRIGHLPIEEISFFLLEALAVCLLAVQFLPNKEKGDSAIPTAHNSTLIAQGSPLTTQSNGPAD